MNNKDFLFEKVIDHISILLNSVDSRDELRKMVILEMTVNKDCQELEYVEVLHLVILRLADFYKDPILEEIWYDYLEAEDDSAKAA